MKLAAALVTTLLGIVPLKAHDSWVQLNMTRAAVGVPVYADLMLGNHGNDHRDFKLASKIPLEGSTLQLIPERGRSVNLKRGLFDNGLTKSDGFWSARVLPPRANTAYCIAHRYDAIVHYAPKRALKSGKAYFASGTPRPSAFYTKALGHPLEIVPLSDPISPKAGETFRVRVLLKGQPLVNAKISCIPRGTTLKKGFDPRHEAHTDANGIATFRLREANYHLLVVHHAAPQEIGRGYSAGTQYGATLTLLVGP